MKRPLREIISESSLMMMGVSKKFCDKTIDDFKTFGVKGLEDVKCFVEGYLEDIDYNIENGRGIFFWGSNGVGKSMLSCIILKEAYRHRYSCRRITFNTYISAYAESWGASKSERDVLEQDLLDKYKGVEFLVLEEVGKEVDSKVVKPILEDLLRYREEQGLATVICTNMTLQDFETYYESSIFSLISGNQTIIKISAKDRRKDVRKGEL